jgi:16S rRNA U1498 N3-methylase RsmE
MQLSDSVVSHLKESRRLTRGDIINSFNDLEPFLDAFTALNESTVFKIDRVGGDEGAQLERLLFIPHYTKSVIDYIYDIIGMYNTKCIQYT